MQGLVMKAMARNLLYPIPLGLRRRQTPIDDVGVQRVRESIQTHFHRGWRAKENYSDAFYQHDLNAHLHMRLASDRRFIIPWLNRARRLNGMRVLEIGCGT